MKKHKCDGCKYKTEYQAMGFKPNGICSREHNLIQAEKSYNAEVCPFEDIKSDEMTVKEATNIILRSVVHSSKTQENLSEALFIMQKALEKQIRKKPVHIHEEYEKHDWQKDENGNVDEFAFEWDDHNGVACTRCCTTYCVYCDPDYDEKGDKCIIDYNKCPNCGRKVTKSEKYCDDCGQALDWSDEERRENDR